MSNVKEAYALAKKVYESYGIDVENALKMVDKVPLSIHCWQGDDCGGFETIGGHNLTGGIQATGNFPGKARTLDELRADLELALKHIPGPKKVNLHANYLDNGGVFVERDQIEPKHFESWANWAVENKIGLDFNQTYFSHKKGESGYTLCNQDEDIRAFWIEHGKRVRKIGQYLADKTGQKCVINLWIPDGEKEVPIDTLAPRLRLKDSLDKILEEKYPDVVDSLECKLFGIGSEAYVPGSHEFYMSYAMNNQDVLLTFDTGHFHPTEQVSNKLSSVLCFRDNLLLHVSRPVRWDSDHVVNFDDETRAIMNEIVRMDATDKVYIALDYFDASINRIIAWIVGARNTRKALLEALLQPVDFLKKMELEGDRSSRLAYTQEFKALPFSPIWDYYCEQTGNSVGLEWLSEIKKYENEVLLKR